MSVQSTIVEQITVSRDGAIHVRLVKQSGEYHRMAVEPGADLETAISVVNGRLESMGEAPIKEGEWDRVRRIVAAEHTPELAEAFATRRGAAVAELSAQPEPRKARQKAKD